VHSDFPRISKIFESAAAQDFFLDEIFYFLHKPCSAILVCFFRFTKLPCYKVKTLASLTANNFIRVHDTKLAVYQKKCTNIFTCDSHKWKRLHGHKLIYDFK